MNPKSDIVYVCRPGDNEELRYSIRSVVAHLKHRKIWVVGYKPDWYVGNFISVPDVGGKFNNIANCLKVAAFSDSISENFIYMNDDFFLLEPLDAIETYHGGLLEDKIEQYLSIASTAYTRLLSRTHRDLVRNGIKKPLDYEMHVPMPMTKSGVLETIDKAYFPRSAYGNLLSISGKEIKDVKTYAKGSILKSRSYNPKTGLSPFVSTEDGSFSDIYNLILKDMFPNKSSYEIK